MNYNFSITWTDGDVTEVQAPDWDKALAEAHAIRSTDEPNRSQVALKMSLDDFDHFRDQVLNPDVVMRN